MRIVHISHEVREKGALGGVAKFAWYLQKAIGCDIVAAGETDLSKYDMVIGDGYFVSGANPDKQIVISVVHGTWKEFSIRNNKIPDFSGEVIRQHQVWSNPKIKKVAVSHASALFLERHHNVYADAIILNGVDTELFKPVEHHNEKPVIIYAANDYNKNGQGELGKIADLLRDRFEFRYLGAEAGEEQDKFAQGDIYIQRSFYEGNPYATLEAMSCGLPVVASSTGLFDIDSYMSIEHEREMMKIGIVVHWNACPEQYVGTICQVIDNIDLYHPREWIECYASFETFKRGWVDFIKETTWLKNIPCL